MAAKQRILTENQTKFLEALFEEAQGKPARAKQLAGYAETVSTREILASLKEEVIELAMLQLAGSSVEAAFAVTQVLQDPNQSGALVKMKAAESILNRVGAIEKPSGDVNLKVPTGGLFIMPAKENKSEVNKD